MSGKVGFDGTGSEGLTVNAAAEAILSSGLLSSEEEHEQTSETPPTPSASEPVEADASTEQAEAEGTPAETEQTESGSEAPEANAADQAKYKVKVDGQELEVTLDEMAKGYSRTADYTRKTQQVAEERKQIEAELATVREQRSQYADYLKQLEQSLQDVVPQEPNWDEVQKTTTPAEFTNMFNQYQAAKKHLDAVKAERSAAEQRVQADQAAMHQQWLESEKVKLAAAIPEWKEAETAKTEKAKIVAFAEGLGVTKEQLSKADAVSLVILRKAMLFDEAQAKKPAIVQRIEKVRTAAPGSAGKPAAPAARMQRMQERLATSGSVKDAAALIQALGI